MEEGYLKSANILRLGESKTASTLFFEGGFSAFKREALERFDPYETGSDDCGTVLSVIEKDFRAMLVSDAIFYSSFPASFRGKISIKLRRTIQLVRVFSKYLDLLVKGKVKAAKKTVIPNTLLYLVFACCLHRFFCFLQVICCLSYPAAARLFCVASCSPSPVLLLPNLGKQHPAFPIAILRCCLGKNSQFGLNPKTAFG